METRVSEDFWRDLGFSVEGSLWGFSMGTT